MNNKLFNLAAFALIVSGLIGAQLPASAETRLPVYVASIAPESGVVGTKVTIKGSGFTKTDNRVNFAQLSGDVIGLENVAATVGSNDGTTLVFEVPDGMAPYCPPGNYCPAVFYEVLPATYRVTVTNERGTSNATIFTVLSGKIDPTPTKVAITNIVPDSGAIGAKVTVIGKGFIKTDNEIIFVPVSKGDVLFVETEYLVARASSENGTTLTFTIPASMSSYFAIYPNSYVVVPGNYRVYIKNTNGGSNRVLFQVTGELEPPKPVPPPSRTCPFERLPVLKKGSRGDDVKKLQDTLGVSPTGYFGPATEAAVKAVESKYSLPGDGIINETDRPIFFPCYRITITSPQRNEVWKIGEAYAIEWTLEAPIIVLPEDNGKAREIQANPPLPPVPTGPPNALPQPISPPSFISKSPIASQPVISPVLDTLTIDLTQNGKFVYHIGDIAAGTGSFKWTVPNSILAGGYRVRIGLAQAPMLYGGDAEKKIYPPGWRGWSWNESADFQIVGADQPIPVTPEPKPTPVLKEQMQQLLRLIEQLQELLKKLLGGS